MTKQLNLDLAAALEDAQQGRDDGEMLIVRAGSAYMKVKAFNAGKHAAALRKIRAPRQRGELRTYPKFTRGMSTAEYVAKFAALNTNAEAMKNNRMPAYVLPFGHLNTAPCALYENGARDFDVIEEIDADDAQSVAAPEVQSAPAAAVDSLYNPGTPDPKNSAALPELDGFKPGDVVDVDGRTIGRSTIELVFLRKLAGFDAEPMARIVGASGKRLDVQLFQLTRVEAPAAPAEVQAPHVAASTEVSPPCGDIAPAAQDVAESKAAAPVEIEAADGAAAPEATPPCEGIAPASPEYVALRKDARVARRAALAAIDTARVSSAQALRELTADDADYSYLIPTDGTHRGGVHAAKNIRLVLKKKFPGVKFKVTSDYSRCSVKWTDGPTDAAVCEALAPFDIGASDSQSDYFYTVATRFSDTYGGVQYLFTSRELGAATIQASIAAIFGDSGPTPEEWKAGRAWSQVSGHGIYSSCAMMDEWEWLAMVRRHANGLDY